MNDAGTTQSPTGGPAAGMKRRTILAGAAWTVPIMVAATTTPAFAASNDLTLKFDKSSYSGQACGTISGAYVTATRNGAAAAGESVTVSLADGYTFSDGSTSSTGTTGSDGRYSLPDIKVPSSGGDSTITATSGNASASATLTSPKQQSTAWIQNDQVKATSGVPYGSTPAYSDRFITPQNDLVSSDGSLIYSGVKSVGQVYVMGADGEYRVGMLLTNGKSVWDDNQIHEASGVPDNSVPIFSNTFLTPSNNLVRSDGSVFLAGVQSVGWIYYKSNGGGYRIPVLRTDGSTGWIEDGNYHATSGVPSNSKPAFSNWFITSNDDLVDSSGNILYANVKSVGQGYMNGESGEFKVGLLLADGSTAWADNSGFRSTTNVPQNSKPAFSSWFITPKNYLVDEKGDVITDRVNSVGNIYYNSNSNSSAGYHYKIALGGPTDC